MPPQDFDAAIGDWLCASWDVNFRLYFHRSMQIATATAIDISQLCIVKHTIVGLFTLWAFPGISGSRRTGQRGFRSKRNCQMGTERQRTLCVVPALPHIRCANWEALFPKLPRCRSERPGAVYAAIRAAVVASKSNPGVSELFSATTQR